MARKKIHAALPLAFTDPAQSMRLVPGIGNSSSASPKGSTMPLTANAPKQT